MHAAVKALAVASALFSSAPAIPQISPQIPSTQFYDGPPPARFDRPAKMIVAFGMMDRCGSPNWKGHPFAYFTGCRRSGVTYLPDPCAYPGEAFARIACHESAHVNGWPATHGE